MMKVKNTIGMKFLWALKLMVLVPIGTIPKIFENGENGNLPRRL
jgi:hypothetical protein